MTKICSKCKRELEASLFGNNKKTKDLLQYTCKECISKKGAERYQKNKEKVLQYCQENKERRKVWRDENKDIIFERNKKYYKVNKEKIYKQQQEWRKNKKRILK